VAIASVHSAGIWTSILLGPDRPDLPAVAKIDQVK